MSNKVYITSHEGNLVAEVNGVKVMETIGSIPDCFGFGETIYLSDDYDGDACYLLDLLDEVANSEN